MTSIPHYMAMPKQGSGPAVLVLHSWWGLNEFFKNLCDRLADAGFVALAPDLYSGKVASTPATARRLRSAPRRKPAYRLLTDAANYLLDQPAVSTSHLALMGFSMGGHWALWLSQRPEIRAAATVVFYAARDGNFKRSGSSFLFHLAEDDEWVSTGSIKRVKKSIEAAGKTATFHVYPATRHWFFESDRPTFDPAAARLAWRRTLRFLRESAL